MNLDMIVSRGLPPWQPSSNAADVEVWDRYDHPMVGTFRLSGRIVLYTLVGDTSQAVSVWAYVLVPAGDEEKFAAARFGSDEQMTEFIQDAFAGNEAVFAMARDLKIWLWTRRAVPSGPGNVLFAAAAALSEMAEVVTKRQPSPEVLFQAELAQVAVVAEDLADV